MNHRIKIDRIPEGHTEGYLIDKRAFPTYHFILADPISHKNTNYFLSKWMDHLITDYMGEFISISNNNGNITITPGGDKDEDES